VTQPVSDVPGRATFADRAFATLQYLLPKHLLSRAMYAFMRSRIAWLKRTQIRTFLRFYAVNLAEAAEPDPLAYPSFNAFFTRALAAGARPIAPDRHAFVSPVDGAVSQCGPLAGDQIIQAKGQLYAVGELLAGADLDADRYRDGSFACLYLAPRDYHRIHMPITGRLLATRYVPGDLFSVNAATARAVPRLFARNERLISEFETEAGRIAIVLVGALFVGSIETAYCGEVNPPPRRRKAVVDRPEGAGRTFAKGEEIGRFNMGSTVVIVAERDRLDWLPQLAAPGPVRMGEPIATCRAMRAASPDD
jgi:phosphatidylserine decarboxylase